MAYDSTTGKITAPYKDGKQYGVEIADLQRCFQVKLTKGNQKGYSCELGAIVKLETGNTTSDGWTVASRRAINMWSKFKPVIINPPQSSGCTIFNTRPQAKYDSTKKEMVWNESLTDFQWWRDTIPVGASVNSCFYGITPKIADSLMVLYRYYDGTNNPDWLYQKPNSISGNAPSRIDDFLGYNHNAPEPLAMLSAPSNIVLKEEGNGGWMISVSMVSLETDFDPVSDRDYVTPQDILKKVWNDADQIYFGFALYDIKNGNTPVTPSSAAIWVTGTTFIGSGISSGLSKNHTYRIIPFYCNKELPQSINTNNGIIGTGLADTGGAKFAVIPGAPELTIVTAPSGITDNIARFSVRSVLQNGRLSVKFTIDATDYGTGASKITFKGGTFTNIKIYVCLPSTTSTSTPPTDFIALYQHSSSVSVSGGEKAYVNYRFVGISERRCKVLVYATNNNTQYLRASGYAMISQDGLKLKDANGNVISNDDGTIPDDIVLTS